MRNDGNGIAGYFLTGLVIGGLLGAILALITAPRSGKEIRQGIRRSAGQLQDRADQILARAQSELDALAENAESRAEYLRSSGEQRIEQLREKMNQSTS